jgi:putative SOS response-associated peptidase YedK
LANENPFAFAGLWEFWRDKENSDNTYRSCTIITRDASGKLKEIHDRMPAVLRPDAYDAWLDVDNQDAESPQEILVEKTVSEFTFRPVSKQVNSVRNNDPSNIS